jgi:hypothetical protein
MVIEYTATPKDVAALYYYTRNHSLKLALVSYGLPVGLAALTLVERRSPGHTLTPADWTIALMWGLVFFFLFPLILRLRTKKDKRTLSIQPDKLATRIGTLSGAIPWAKMDELYITDEYVFLIRKNMNGFAIPRRAFLDDTQRTEFIRLSGQYLQAARNND